MRDGYSGLLVDTHDPRDWAAALARVIGDGRERDRLAAGAVVQARQFSWDETARQTIEVYLRARSRMRSSVR